MLTVFNRSYTCICLHHSFINQAIQFFACDVDHIPLDSLIKMHLILQATILA